ncbi:MAG TPA: helix-turn-helix domain-containing protein [Solirubrobacteraceae bacterium]|nr:helix-turn-helix domain-containing protein [Solirubrobacteraceae bacterium]
MASDDGLTIKLFPEQVQEIVERAGRGEGAGCGDGTDGRRDLAQLLPALQRLLAEADGKFSLALLRGVATLVAFPGDGTPRRLSEVAAELSFARSTVHRCLCTLVAMGLLEQDSETQRYLRRGQFFV